MKTYLEKQIAKDDITFWDETLESQVQAYGKVELPTLFRELKNRKPKKVLDIGTGNGSFLVKVAKAFPQIQITAIDHNKGLLELCKRRLEQSQIENVSIRETFFDQRGIPEDFDFIWTRYTLAHVGDKPAFVKGVSNSLKPGGAFLALESAFSFAEAMAEGFWKDYLSRFRAAFTKWGTESDVGLKLPKWIEEEGLKLVDNTVRLTNPQTSGEEEFLKATLKTLAMFHKQFPEIVTMDWAKVIEEQLPKWKELPYPPSLALCQTLAEKP